MARDALKGREASSHLLLFQLEVWHLLLSQRWALGNKSHADRDEHDSRPALHGDGLIQPEAGEKGDDDIAKGGGRKYEREVCPGERREITCEETNQQRNSSSDPWSENCVDEREGMGQGNRRQAGHAA